MAVGSSSCNVAGAAFGGPAGRDGAKPLIGLGGGLQRRVWQWQPRQLSLRESAQGFLSKALLQKIEPLPVQTGRDFSQNRRASILIQSAIDAPRRH